MPGKSGVDKSICLLSGLLRPNLTVARTVPGPGRPKSALGVLLHGSDAPGRSLQERLTGGYAMAPQLLCTSSCPARVCCVPARARTLQVGDVMVSGCGCMETAILASTSCGRSLTVLITMAMVSWTPPRLADHTHDAHTHGPCSMRMQRACVRERQLDLREPLFNICILTGAGRSPELRLLTNRENGESAH